MLRTAWLFVVLCILANAVLPSLVDYLPSGSREPFLWGFLFGECCFVVLVSALMGRTWVSGFMLGTMLLTAGSSALMFGLWFADEPFEFAAFHWIPPFLLCAATPLFVLRQLCGWRLIEMAQPVPMRDPIVITDLFSFIAIVGTVIVLVRAPAILWEIDSEEYWVVMAIVGASAASVGALFLPLSAKFAFTSKTRVAAVSALLLLALGLVITTFAVLQVYYLWEWGDWEWYFDDVPELLTSIGAGIPVFYLSLLALVSSGVTLVRAKPTPADNRTTSVPNPPPQRLLTGLQILTAIAVATAVSVYLHRLEAWRAAKDLENERIAKLAESLGGEAFASYYREITSLELSGANTDENLKRFLSCNHLDNLTLNGSDVTDNGLRTVAEFRGLDGLYLDETSVSDEGLKYLSVLDKLTWLSLKQTDVSGAGLVQLSSADTIWNLDLSGSRLDDEGCQAIERFHKLWGLQLAGVEITDRGLASIAKLRLLHQLDLADSGVTDRGLMELERLTSLGMLRLSGTRVDGRGFPPLPALEDLQLDRTQVTDDSLAVLVESLSGYSPTIRSLSLARTAVTDASFQRLQRLTGLTSLDLSDTRVTDAGIATLGKRWGLEDLDLSGTQVTGLALGRWQHRLSSLTLDRTSIDDEGLAAMKQMPAVDTLSLARTNVTDAGLKHLAGIVNHWLDLRHTSVSADGLIAARLTRPSYLYVAEGQFSDAELSRLKQRLSCQVIVQEAEGEESDE